MKPDLTSPEPGRPARPRHEAGGGGSPHLKLVHSRRWTHTLVLTGELSARSAPALEEEIEGLCQEGVAGLRLDLRQLKRIDHVGIAVIAFRSQECIRRGYSFEVMCELPVVRHALHDAGVAIVPPEPERRGGLRLTVHEGGQDAATVRLQRADRGRLSRWRPRA